MFGPGSSIRNIGHRGAAGVAPENTLESIERGVAAGADAIEVDVHVSAEGTLILMHDDAVDRTTNGTGAVEEMPLSDLRRLDAGYRFSAEGGRTFPFRDAGIRVPTLDEAAEACGDLPMVVEVKSPRSGQALGDWLQLRRDRDRFLVGGFERADVEAAAAHAAWRCASRADLTPFVLAARLGLPWQPARDISAFMLPIRKGPLRLVTRRFVDRAHAAGVGVYVWTVNRAGVMRSLLDLGVDGLISDVPARTRRILDERG